MPDHDTPLIATKVRNLMRYIEREGLLSAARYDRLDANDIRLLRLLATFEREREDSTELQRVLNERALIPG